MSLIRTAAKPIARALLPGMQRLARMYVEREAELDWVKVQRSDASRPNERPLEYSFAFRKISELYPQSILDVGTGQTAWPHVLSTCGFHVTAIDNRRDYWTADYWNRHWHVLDDNILDPAIDKKFDVITCLSVLEHIKDHDRAMKNLFGLLAPGGHILLTCPYNRTKYYADVYKEPHIAETKSYAFICQLFSESEVDRWLTSNGGKLAGAEYYRVFEGKLWREGKTLHPPVRVDADEGGHLACLDIVKE